MTPYREPHREPPARESVVTPAPAPAHALVGVVTLLALASAGLTFAAVLDWTEDAFLPGLGALLSGSAAVGVLFADNDGVARRRSANHAHRP